MFDGSEGESDSRLNFGHAGCLGVVVVDVDGIGVDHQSGTDVKPVCERILCSGLECPRVVVVLDDMLVVGACDVVEKLYVEAFVGVPSCELCVERECEAVGGTEAYSHSEHVGCGH